MRKVINPYQTLPFYSVLNREGNECPLHCPTRNLVPFQLTFDFEVTGFAWGLNSSEGYSIGLSGDLIEAVSTSDGKTTLTYKGGDILTSPSNGTYRIYFVVNGFTYYSHVICISDQFRSLEINLAIACAVDLDPPITQPTEAFYFTITKTAPLYGVSFLEVNIEGQGWERFAGTLDWRDFEDLTGEKTVFVKCTVLMGDVQVVRTYRLVFNVSDACGTVVFESVETSTDGLESYVYIEFWNTNDMQERDLLYQTGFKQRLYFKAHYGFPIPVQERSFIKNGREQSILQSSVAAERLPIDAYPVPDSIVLALSAIGDHDNYVLGFTADGSTQALNSIDFERRNEENDDCSAGRFIVEYSRSFVACEENKTIV